MKAFNIDVSQVIAKSMDEYVRLSLIIVNQIPSWLFCMLKNKFYFIIISKTFLLIFMLGKFL